MELSKVGEVSRRYKIFIIFQNYFFYRNNIFFRIKEKYCLEILIQQYKTYINETVPLKQLAARILTV